MNAASTLFTNVDIFNGTENKLYEDHNVLVIGNKISKISKESIDVADILLVEGNPLEDISLLGATPQWFDADPEYQQIDTIKLVMKDGVVYRNTL